MIERADVDHPMWRKKVDGTLLREGWTPIPKWLWEIWAIENLFGSVLSKKARDAQVSIAYNGSSYTGQVARVKSNDSYRYRLYIERELKETLSEVFLMTYMRVIESEITLDKNHRQIEDEISFWEFLDIEFDSKQKEFKLSAHFTVKPQFPNLFSRLIKSAPLKAVSADVLDKNSTKIHKQEWKPRAAYKSEIGAENVIYMLLDKTNKLIYVGEANNLVKRLTNGHPDITDWDYYKYNVLPPALVDYRLAIERMTIRDMAALLANKQGIPYIAISNYSLANRKIDM
jgi:hypothetical protein